MGSDVFFVLCSVEEGEGEDGDGCCTPNVPESTFQKVSVLVVGSSSNFGSCDEAQLSGRTGNVHLLLGLHVWPLPRTDQVEVRA